MRLEVDVTVLGRYFFIPRCVLYRGRTVYTLLYIQISIMLLLSQYYLSPACRPRFAISCRSWTELCYAPLGFFLFKRELMQTLTLKSEC